MCGAAGAVKEDSGKYMVHRTESSGFDLLVQPEFVLISQKAAVYVRMCTRGSEQMLIRLEDEIDRDLLARSAKIAAEREIELTTEKDDQLLLLTENNKSKEN